MGSGGDGDGAIGGGVAAVAAFAAELMVVVMQSSMVALGVVNARGGRL